MTNSNGRPATINPEILDQQPPANEAIERRILGMFIVAPETMDTLAGSIRAEHFYSRRHAKLFEHLQELRNGGGGKVDMALLRTRLKQSSDYEDIGGGAYLGELMDQCGMPGLAANYARDLVDFAGRRAMRAMAEDLIRDAQSGQVSASALVRRHGRHATALPSHPQGNLSDLRALRPVVHFRGRPW